MSEEVKTDPIDAIQADMNRHNWTAADLVRLTGYSRFRISEYLLRRRSMPKGFIRAYHAIPDTAPLEILIQDYPLAEVKS